MSGSRIQRTLYQRDPDYRKLRRRVYMYKNDGFQDSDDDDDDFLDDPSDPVKRQAVSDKVRTILRRFGKHVFRAAWGLWIIIRTACSHHWFGMCLVMCSAAMGLLVGDDGGYIDNIYFTSLGLLFAVLLGQRARNAILRRQFCIQALWKIWTSGLNIVHICAPRAPDVATKLEIVKLLTFLYEEIAQDIVRQSSKSRSSVVVRRRAIRLGDLNRAVRDRVFVCKSKPLLRYGPRGLIFYVVEMLDEWIPFAEHETADQGRFQGLVNAEVKNLLASYDWILATEEEGYTVEYQLLIAIMLLVYLGMIPWTALHQSTAGLFFVTITVSFVFYALNAITLEHEDPFGNHASDFNVQKIYQSLIIDLQREVSVRDEARVFLRQFKDAVPEEGMSIDSLEELSRLIGCPMYDIQPFLRRRLASLYPGRLGAASESDLLDAFNDALDRDWIDIVELRHDAFVRRQLYKRHSRHTWMRQHGAEEGLDWTVYSTLRRSGVDPRDISGCA